MCVCLAIVGHTICTTTIPTLMDKSFLWLCFFFFKKCRERMREHNRFHFQNGWLAFLLLFLTKLIFQQSCCWTIYAIWIDRSQSVVDGKYAKLTSYAAIVCVELFCFHNVSFRRFFFFSRHFEWAVATHFHAHWFA